MEKTLGGDRLGSGKKMKVHLHNYERSTHDLSYIWRSTMSAGTLVPFLVEVALPGDTFDIDLNCMIRTLPTVGPLFGSMKVQLDVFTVPMRLYQAQLHNNQLGIGMNMSNVWLPQLILPATPTNYDLVEEQAIINIDNIQINPSCILNYLGIRGVGQNPQTSPLVTRAFNGIPLLAYWDIFKNYYSNKQEEAAYVIHNIFPVGAVGIDSIRIYTESSPDSPFNVNEVPIVANTGAAPLRADSYIELLYTTGPVDLSTVWLILTNGAKVRLDEIGVVIFESVDTYKILFDWEKFGNLNVKAWRVSTQFESNKFAVRLQEFALSNLDDMRNLILQHPGGTPFDIINTGLAPYIYLTTSGGGDAYSMLGSQEGLAVKTYQSDMLNNWLNKETIEGANGISEVTAVDTTAGFFTIDTLALSKKVYFMLNRIAVSGGTYEDWIDAVYTHDRYYMISTPMYSGGLIKELQFQEVVSNSEATGDGTQPLGTLAGKGVMGEKHKGGKVTIKTDEPCYIMGIVSITPRIDQSQGNRWDTGLKTLDDLHKPQLDEIGFEDLITEKLAWWDTYYDTTPATWVQKSAGKQPSWMNYMSNYNRVYGNFAIQDDNGFMVLTRNYEPIQNIVSPQYYMIKDLTTYIDPAKYNQIFAQTSLDSQNYWVQIGVDIEARRKMSAKVMPNL